jgi:hypothetical protein
MQVNKTSIAILTGKEDLSQWSDEELERGQRRDKGRQVPEATHHHRQGRP